jgi:hypothetical protein
MILLALNNKDQVSPFILKVYRLMNADGFLWMDKNQFLAVNGDMNTVNHSYGDPIDNSTVVIIFDIFLVPTLIFLKKYNHCEFTFIQHGVFSDLTVDFRPKKKTLGWLLRSIKLSIRFLLCFGISINNLLLLKNIFIHGGWFCRTEIDNLSLSIDLAIFWNETDRSNVSESFPNLIKHYHLVESPDKEHLKLKYSPDGMAIYISQPLVEDALVDDQIYTAFLKEQELLYGDDLLVLKHPRDTRHFNNSISLSNITHDIEVRLVIGHFSSLILAVDKNIPVQFVNFEDQNITTYCNYIETSRKKYLMNASDLKSFEAIRSISNNNLGRY